MKFKSLDEIIDCFELEVAEKNVKNIRTSLIPLLAEFHPDKSGGKFESDNQKDQYNNIQEAINYLDSINSQENALVNINQITEIIKTVTEAVAPKKESDKSNIVSQLKTELKREIKSSYNPIKISSGTIAGLSVGLISFSETLNGDAVRL